MIFGNAFNDLAFMVLPIYAALERIDPRLGEAANDLYAGKVRAFWHTTLPLSRSGIFAGVLLVFIDCVGDPVNSALLGGTNTYTIGQAIQDAYSGNQQYNVAAALRPCSWSCSASSCSSTPGCPARRPRGPRMTAVTPTRAGRPRRVTRLVGLRRRPQRRRRGVSRRGPWLAILYWVVIAITLVPIVYMVAYSFNDAPTNRLTFAWNGFTTYWYQNLWNVSGLGAAFGTSVLVAFLAAIVSVAIGLPLALALERYRFPGRGRRQLDRLRRHRGTLDRRRVGLAVVLPVDRARTGFWTILLTHVAFDVAYVVVVLRARIAGTSKVLEEAAGDLGATPFQRSGSSRCRSSRRACSPRGLLALAMSIDDYVITSFVAAPRSRFPLFVYGAAKAGMPPQVLCFGTLVFAVGLLVALLNGALNRRLARTRG